MVSDDEAKQAATDIIVSYATPHQLDILTELVKGKQITDAVGFGDKKVTLFEFAEATRNGIYVLTYFATAHHDSIQQARNN